MTDEPPIEAFPPVIVNGEVLLPATPAELIETLAFALHHDGRRRTDVAHDFTARIAAQHLVKKLLASRFVLMKRPPDKGH